MVTQLSIDAGDERVRTDGLMKGQTEDADDCRQLTKAWCRGGEIMMMTVDGKKVGQSKVANGGAVHHTANQRQRCRRPGGGWICSASWTRELQGRSGWDCRGYRIKFAAE